MPETGRLAIRVKSTVAVVILDHRTSIVCIGLHSVLSTQGIPKTLDVTSDNVRYVMLIIKKARFFRGKILPRCQR